MISVILVCAGLAILIVGGELLVRGSVATAERLGMSRLLIGITLVGFGTSAPELVTSVQASLAGSPGIAVGNIVGSNIANMLLILGIAAMITPIAVTGNVLQRDGMIVLGCTIIFCAVGLFMPLDRIVGGVFLLGLFSYLYFVYRQETFAHPVENAIAEFKTDAPYSEFSDVAPAIADASGAGVVRGRMGLQLSLFMAIGGLLIIVLGGKLLVEGATGIARAAGISEAVIGLTIVAIGTSLPELVTSVIAALRRHTDLALGNVLGSNIYNLLGIGGVTALVAPTTMPQQIVFSDNFIMLAITVILLLVAWRFLGINRWFGTAFAAGYGSYMYFLWPI